MSRRMNTNARGRQSQPTATRGPQLKLTFGGKTGQKNGARAPTTISKNTKKRRAPSFSEAESTTSGGDTDGELDVDEDEGSDDADDESDDPEADASLHNLIPFGEAGPIFIDQQGDDTSDEESEWGGFPELPGLEGGDDATFKKYFESDDEEAYEKVNEISDSDEEPSNRTPSKAELDLLNADLSEDMTSHFANQIDGMSAYGFGDDSEEEGSIFFPFSSGDEANEIRDRRVHFEEQQSVKHPNAFTIFGKSPTMSRALLPSALPDMSDEAIQYQRDTEQSEDDGYDSDETVELENPKEQWKLIATNSPGRAERSPPATAAMRKTPGQKTPSRGIFEDTGDKTVAILDPTGKKLLLQDPHLLGGVFARKYGPSAPASPCVSFASAVFNESDSSQDSGSPRPQTAPSQPTVDLMFSSLTSGEHASTNGQAIGFPEAFMPANVNFLNSFMSAPIFDDTEIDPEDSLRIEDMIDFDGSDDETNPNSPAHDFMPTSFSAPGTPLSHLNHMNVTAFKRKADPNFPGVADRPSPMRNKFTTPLKRKRGSARNDSPYSKALYEGVTPVQRVTYFEHEQQRTSSPAPISARTHKRRKTIL